MPVPRPSHVAARLLPSWMICSTNQGRAHFEFQMLAGKSQAGTWALGNSHEENGFVLKLPPSRRAWGASLRPLCPAGLEWVTPPWHSSRKPSTYLSTFWGAGVPGAALQRGGAVPVGQDWVGGVDPGRSGTSVAAGMGPSAAAL